MKIILARHGESEGNRHKIIQGHSDYPLSDLGIKQAKELAKWFVENKTNLTEIYSSDLKRAALTAVIIAKELDDKNIVIDRRLREFNLGKFQDRELASLSPEEQVYMDSFWENTSKKVPKGESVDEMKARIKEAFNEITANHKQTDTILIVGHGGTLYHIITSTLGFNLDLRKEWFGNCQRTEIVYNHESKDWLLITFNNKPMKIESVEKS
ncbi:MAG: histidine phosphatase family protein [Asgard group archaeon]|nr:histidine phosphatase family protein [Asgard group archaeon]